MKATFADFAVGDWDRFYEHGGYDRIAYIGREAMPELLGRFLDRVGVPADVASVGCGPAATLFALADRYPGVEFHGYDVSGSVVEDDAALAAEHGLDNLRFAQGALPALDVDRRFDLVYCLATLYFVDDTERAVRSLYDRVRDGGHLVFNYPNRHTMAAFDAAFEGDRRDLFARVIDGENLLSRDRVGELLGEEPRDYWAAVDATDREFVGPETPCVYVEK